MDLTSEQIRAIIREELEIFQRRAATPAPLLDVGAVATWLSVSERTVETLVAQGLLVPVWVEGQRRFTRDAVDAYIRSAAGRRRTKRKRRPAEAARQ